MATMVHHLGRNDAATRAELRNRVVSEGLAGTKSESVFESFSERLVAAGLPINRAYSAMRLLHPLYSGFGLIWQRDEAGIKEELYGASPVRSEAWLKSPLKVLFEDGVVELRRRITGPEVALEFPVLDDFRKQGATDYFAT